MTDKEKLSSVPLPEADMASEDMTTLDIRSEDEATLDITSKDKATLNTSSEDTTTFDKPYKARNKQAEKEAAEQAARENKRAQKSREAAREQNAYRVMPFVRSSQTTTDCMFMVFLALLPSFGFGIYMYGIRAVLLVGISIATAFFWELILGLIVNRRLTVIDCSCLVTGMVGGLILPPTVPYVYPVIASTVAIVFGKMAFGGLGKNILNPAATGKLVLLILYRFVLQTYFHDEYIAYSPLRLLMDDGVVDLKEMALGHVPEMIGTGSVIAIAAGVVLLLLTDVIDLSIPLSYIAGFAVFYILFGRHGLNSYYLVYHLCGGGLLFTAFFMAPDYTTSPMTRKGKIWYGILMGVTTGILRVVFGIAESSALLALLIGNALSRLIDLRTQPVAFGARLRPVRNTARGDARQQALREEREDALEREMEAHYAAFEKAAQAMGGLTGSETAGTIDAESIEADLHRKRVTRRGQIPVPQATDAEIQRAQKLARRHHVQMQEREELYAGVPLGEVVEQVSSEEIELPTMDLPED